MDNELIFKIQFAEKRNIPIYLAMLHIWTYEYAF